MAATFRWPAGPKGKDYTVADHVISHNNRAIKRTARQAKSIIASGFHVEVIAGVPVFVAGDRGEETVRNPLTGAMISVGSRIYNNLIRSGWVHSDGGGLVQPESVTITPLDVADAKDLGGELVEVLNGVGGGDLPLYLSRAEGVGKMVRLLHAPALHVVLSAAQELAGEYDYGLEPLYEKIAHGVNPLAGLVLIHPKTMKADSQFVAAAGLDGLCVRRCLEERFPAKDWSTVPECCGDQDMDVIARANGLVIRVWAASQPEGPLRTWRSGNNTGGARGSVFDLWYQFNHVMIMPKDLKFADETAPVTFYETQEELLAAFYGFLEKVPVRPMVGGKEDCPEFLGFSTPTEHHKKTFNGHLRQPAAWSETGASRREFIASNGRPLQQRRLRVNRMGGVVNDAIYHNTGFTGITYRYDQRRAYSNFKLCAYYSGFPKPGGVFEVFQWDDKLLSEDVEGVALVETRLRWPATAFESTRLWAPLPQVRYARDRGEKFEVLAAVLSERVPDPYEGVRANIGDDDKMVFNRLVGRHFMSEVTPMRVATSADERDAMLVQGWYVMREFAVDAGRTIWLCGARTPESKDPEFPYVAAYVHAYQKITLHKDLLARLPEVGMSWERDVVRVWVDGVSLKKPLPDGFLDESRWRYEGTRVGFDYGCRHGDRPTRVAEVPRPVAYDRNLLSSRVALLGPPGSGKSWDVDAYWCAGRRAVKSASTHAAKTVLGPEAVTTQGLLRRASASPAYFRDTFGGIDRLVVDEFTMLSRDELEAVLALNVPVLFSGDFEQLCNYKDPITIDWLREKGFTVVEKEKIHRAATPETLDLYYSCRYNSIGGMAKACVAAGVPRVESKEVALPGPWERAHYLASRNDEVRRVSLAYAESFGGVPQLWGRAHKNTDTRLTAPAAPGMLVICVKTSKTGMYNQETGFITAVHGPTVTVRRQNGEEVNMALTRLNPGFAITYHRCQGQTFDFPLYASLDNLFLRVMLYVAITRVTDLKHLRLVGGPRDLGMLPHDESPNKPPPCDLLDDLL